MSTVGERVPELEHVAELADWRAQGWRFRVSPAGSPYVATKDGIRLYGSTLSALLTNLSNHVTTKGLIRHA